MALFSGLNWLYPLNTFNTYAEPPGFETHALPRPGGTTGMNPPASPTAPTASLSICNCIEADEREESGDSDEREEYGDSKER